MTGFTEVRLCGISKGLNIGLIHNRDDALRTVLRRKGVLLTTYGERSSLPLGLKGSLHIWVSSLQ